MGPEKAIPCLDRTSATRVSQIPHDVVLTVWEFGTSFVFARKHVGGMPEDLGSSGRA